MKYGTLAHLSADSKTLMIKKGERFEDPNSGYYTLPGGKIEKEEKGSNSKGRLECVVREVLQETGLTLVNPSLKGIILFDNEGRTFPNWPNPDNFLVYVFITNSYSGKLEEKSEEGTPLWIPDNRIRTLPKNPGDVRIYEWLKEGNFFSGVIKHKGNELDEENTFVDYF